MKEHAVIFVPGLDDRTRWVTWATRNWQRKYGLSPRVHRFPWANTNEAFSEKLINLNRIMEVTKQEFELVSLVGISAGGSAVIGALSFNHDLVHRLITVCSRLRVGEEFWPSLKWAAHGQKTFVDSIRFASGVSKLLTPNQRAQVMTISAGLFDELVPRQTSSIEGATNITLPTAEHTISIACSFLFPQAMINFLKR